MPCSRIPKRMLRPVRWAGLKSSLPRLEIADVVERRAVQIGAAADEQRHLRRERLQHVLAGLARGDLAVRGELGDRGEQRRHVGRPLGRPLGEVADLGPRIASSVGQLGVLGLPGLEGLGPRGVGGAPAPSRARRRTRAPPARRSTCSAGSPSPLRAASANFAPPSPCAFCVPSTSGIPLPMSVLAMMSCGLPLPAFLARTKAAKKASISWPSTVCTSNPIASNRLAVSSLCVSLAIASSVTAFES